MQTYSIAQFWLFGIWSPYEEEEVGQRRRWPGGEGLHLPEIWGWLPGWSLELSSWAWMVSTTRLNLRLGPEQNRADRRSLSGVDAPRLSEHLTHFTQRDQTFMTRWCSGRNLGPECFCSCHCCHTLHHLFTLYSTFCLLFNLFQSWKHKGGVWWQHFTVSLLALYPNTS